MAIRIPNYPSYTIDEHGNVWSDKSNKFLKPASNNGGYKSVELFNENGSKRMLIHRLVAKAFIPNPDNYPQVNHKDENPGNNDVTNLEWCDPEYNMNYGNGKYTRHLKTNYSSNSRKETARKNGKMASVCIGMFSKNGGFIKRFDSEKLASIETGIDHTAISRAVSNKRKTAGGFIWKRMERSEDLLVSQY